MAIQQDIDIINEGLEWLRVNKPQEYERAFITLVEGRRRLARQQRALAENPAIGAFGESQTGKSYQMNTLLNRSDKPFRIKSTDHPEGIGFVDSINPIGDDREATGVVTRFTAFANHPERYNPDYPVIVKLLSVGQLATILSAGYYRNIRDYKNYSQAESKKIVSELTERYSGRPDLGSNVLREDDILDIKSYLHTYVEAQTQEMMRSNLFETIAKIIGRVPSGEWSSVLKYLWHENEVITRLFDRLVSDLQRFDFAPEVYVPLETVIHGGENRRTIMSVACLNGLDQKDWNITTPVYVPQNGSAKDLRKVADFLTCDLCALSAEVIFRIDPEYLDEKLHYCYDDTMAGAPGFLPRTSRGKLSDDIEKTLLKDNDLLDFPGARSDEHQDEANCKEGVQDKEGRSVLVKLFLRGKISYLFDHYGESHMMKVLMFCHHHKQSEVKSLHVLIDQWVRRNVGDTVEDRKRTLDRTGGISPLMIVATKINIDMTFKNHESLNSETAVNNRWEDRFRTVLLDDVLNWSYADWYRNWSANGRQFKDTYLLRSYEYSSCTPVGNQMFRGYDVNTCTPEQSLEMDPAYYRLLRTTFINNPSVGELFSDPELAWDVAATLNNDGAYYIIERMSKVAKVAADIRQEQMHIERDKIMQDVRDILASEYDSENESEKLLHNIDTAGNIRWEFDASCTEDSYYFGHLLQALQVSEDECTRVVHKLVHGTAIVNDLHNMKEYQLILRRCNNFKGCSTDEQRWAVLQRSYGWRTREIATEQLKRRGIDPKILFEPDMRPKTNQVFLADHIMDLWTSKVNSDELLSTFTGQEGFSPVLMRDLTGTLISSAKRLGLADLVAERIREEVNLANVSQIKVNLVADVMATTINSFVNDFGYSLLSEAQKENARLIVAENNLPVYDYIDAELKSSYTHDELTSLFEHIFEQSGGLTESFENRYYTWLEYMTVAFVVHLKQSELPAEVNRALGELIDKISFDRI